MMKRRRYSYTQMITDVDIFDKVPEVEKCCYYLRLKWGSVVIAIITALDGLCLIINPYPITKSLSGCNYHYSPRCAARTFLDFLFYFDAFRGVVNIAASFGLLIGIFMKQVLAVTIFLSTLSIHIILGIIISTSIILASCFGKHCMMSAEDSTYCFVVIVIVNTFNLYFLLVVKSYRSDLISYIAESTSYRSTTGSRQTEPPKSYGPENFCRHQIINGSHQMSGSQEIVPQNISPQVGPEQPNGSQKTDRSEKTQETSVPSLQEIRRESQKTSNPNETNESNKASESHKPNPNGLLDSNEVQQSSRPQGEMGETSVTQNTSGIQNTSGTQNTSENQNTSGNQNTSRTRNSSELRNYHCTAI